MSICRAPYRTVLATLVIAAFGSALAPPLAYAAKPSPPAPPVKFTLTVVPLEYVTGMNNHGDMVDGGTNLYLHGTGEVYDLSAPINDLLDDNGGGTVHYVYDINDAWQVAGGFVDAQGVGHGFRCSLGVVVSGGNIMITASSLARLPELAGYPWGEALAINNAGDVVGDVSTSDGQEWRAVIWPASGGVIRLTDVFSKASDISDRDTSGNFNVTGFMNRAFEQHAFLYESAKEFPLTDLGVLPRRTVSFGSGVNEHGQVAGDSAGGNRTQHAFRYTPGIGMVDLGVFSGDSASHAWAINRAGQVVGTSTLQGIGFFEEHAFLYTDANKLLNLLTLITNPPAGLDPKYLEARAINNYPEHNFGQIAAVGRVNGVWSVFLLTPDR